MFDVKKHLIKVQGGRQYLPVAARLVWFRQEHPDWGIETRAVTIDTERQYAVFEARVYNAEGKLMATGTKMENVKGFPDFIEKAETGSIGRALAVCGFGTQFAPDLDETASTHGAPRVVDSPQPAGGRPAQNGYSGGSTYRNGRGNYSSPSRFGADAAGENGEGRPAMVAVDISGDTKPQQASHAPALRNDSNGLGAAATERGADSDDLFEAPSRLADTSGAESNTCSACGKALNSAQQTLSVRKYGVALCPTCQKERRALEV